LSKRQVKRRRKDNLRLSPKGERRREAEGDSNIIIAKRGGKGKPNLILLKRNQEEKKPEEYKIYISIGGRGNSSY